MTTPNERIQQRMVELGLKQADLMRGTGAGRATVSSWVNGPSAPSGNYLVSVADILKTTPEWLMTGRTAVQTGIGLAQESLNLMASPDANMISIPIYSVKASCGRGSENPQEEIIEHMKFDPNWLTMQGIKANPSKLKIIFSTDYSMWPTVEPESLLIVDTSDNDATALKSGKVYVFAHDDELRMKRFFVSSIGNEIRLSSDNPDKTKWPDEVVSKEQANGIRLVGRVVGRWGEM